MADIQIPNPLPSNHQDLLEVFWAAGAVLDEGKGPDDRRATRADIASVMPPRVNFAVFLASMNYQVENGGWKQWMDNGYSGDGVVLLPMLEAAADLDIPDAKAVHDVLKSALDDIREHQASGRSDFGWTSLDDDDCDVFRTLCDEQDLAFYAIEGRLALYQAMLDRFDEIANHRLAQFFNSGFQKAA